MKIDTFLFFAHFVYKYQVVMAFSRANLCDEYLKELRIPGDPLIKGQIAAVVYLALLFEIMAKYSVELVKIVCLFR